MNLIKSELELNSRHTIAVLGATSQIAKDLIRQWSKQHRAVDLHLYARNTAAVDLFIHELDSDLVLRIINIADFKNMTAAYDAIINFVGVGDPSKAQAMASSILDVTIYYDDLVIQYLKDNPKCKYIFLSSGAVYGSDYSEPASLGKKSSFDINNIQQSEKYGLAKFITEVKHRALEEYQICDLRIFNYFSRYQNMDARFFITDVLRALNDGDLCEVSSEPMVRDYLHPSDFCQIIDCILNADKANMVADCYSSEPVEKSFLLKQLEHRYGLKWKYSSSLELVVATGSKQNYYSEYLTLARIGYKPCHSSLSGLFMEFDALLNVRQ